MCLFGYGTTVQAMSALLTLLHLPVTVLHVKQFGEHSFAVTKATKSARMQAKVA